MTDNQDTRADTNLFLFYALFTTHSLGMFLFNYNEILCIFVCLMTVELLYLKDLATHLLRNTCFNLEKAHWASRYSQY